MDKKVVLITGASSGIGKATAIQLINEGHIVYGVARRVGMMEELRQMGVHTMAMDVTKEEQIQEVINQIIVEQGRIDVLFNNAGFGLYGSVEDVTIADAKYQFEVNIFGVARVTQLVLPHMRQAGKGRIINMSSIGGKIYTPFGAWYHATKHAIEGWSDVLRLEVKNFGIHVIILEPGFIETEFGNIVYDAIVDKSKDSVYHKMATKMAEATKETYKKGAGSPPTVIAAVVSKAIKARKPKTRYLAGKSAKSILFLRKTISDKMFDKVIMSQVN